MQGTCITGKYTGDGSAKNISLGFKPKVVMVVNFTDGDNIFWHFDTMTDDTGILVSTAVATDAAGNVTLYGGSIAANPQGFTVGAGMSESGKEFHYAAWRGE